MMINDIKDHLDNFNIPYRIFGRSNISIRFIKNGDKA